MLIRESPWVVSDGLWERLEPLLPRTHAGFGIPGAGRWMIGGY
jgi:transposase